MNKVVAKGFKVVLAEQMCGTPRFEFVNLVIVCLITHVSNCLNVLCGSLPCSLLDLIKTSTSVIGHSHSIYDQQLSRANITYFNEVK